MTAMSINTILMKLKKKIKGKLYRIMPFEKYPDFLLFGAQKSGTTSLHNYLNSHPDIFMSSPLKEPGFFMPLNIMQEYFGNKGVKIKSHKDLLMNHMLCGYAHEKVFGESSTYYTLYDQSIKYKIPQKINKINPNIKFIYVLRNPISRIISNYKHRLRLGQTRNELNVELNENPLYLTSLYHWQIKNYLVYFPKENFKIIIFEEFILEPQNTMNSIYKFLELSSYDHHHHFKKFHQSNNQMELKIAEHNYDKIINLLKKDIIALEKFLGRSLTIWDVSKEKWCDT